MRKENNNLKYLCPTVVIVVLLLITPMILDRIAIFKHVTTLGVAGMLIRNLPKILDSTTNLILAIKS